MACKYYVHYDVCNDRIKSLDMFEITDFENNVENKCADFKEKSRVIELPCKVGDIVYETDGIRIYELTILDISLHKNKLYYETKNIDFDEEAIGKSIFLTRQEAEAKLKEVKNDTSSSM